MFGFDAGVPAVKVSAFEALESRACAVCGGAIQGVVCSDSVGRDAHFGCACRNLYERSERRHAKRCRQQQHAASWRMLRTRRRARPAPPKSVDLADWDGPGMYRFARICLFSALVVVLVVSRACADIE